MNRTAIVAAFPGEIMPLVKSTSGPLRHERKDGLSLWSRTSAGREWTAACAGAGQQAATRAFAAIEKDGSVARIVSLGWAGALTHDFLPGYAYSVSEVIDAQTGERFATAQPQAGCVLVTTSRVADAAEKRRLVSAYSAALVDMEAAAIARLALMRGIPFYCIKGVSDGVADRLPDFNRFLDSSGQLRLVQLTLFATFRPWSWPSLIRMGENSHKASLRIAESLRCLLDE
jgi:adenosylhomocysteine nucleosidase